MWTKKSGPRHDLHLFPPLTHRTHMMTWKKRDRNNERVIITPHWTTGVSARNSFSEWETRIHSSHHHSGAYFITFKRAQCGHLKVHQSRLYEITFVIIRANFGQYGDINHKFIVRNHCCRWDPRIYKFMLHNCPLKNKIVLFQLLNKVEDFCPLPIILSAKKRFSEWIMWFGEVIDWENIGFLIIFSILRK